MNWIAFAPLLAATLLLVLQGWSYLLVKDSGTSQGCYAGALTTLLAILGMVLYALFATGALLVSVEFRLALVEGTAAAIALGLIVVGFSIATGLGWHGVRCAKKLPSRAPWILLIGAMCGIATAARIRMLSPEENVLYLDRWSPVMVIWLAVCVSESLITFTGVRDRWTRIWFGMLLPVGLALYAVNLDNSGFWFADRMTPLLWNTTLLFGLPALMFSGAFLMADKWLAPKLTARRWLRIAVSAACGAGGLLSAGIWIWKRGNFPSPFTPWFLTLAWAVLLVLFTVERLLHLRREGNLRVPHLGKTLVAWSMMVLVAGCFADIVHFGWLSPILDLVVVVVAWVVLLEAIREGPPPAVVLRTAYGAGHELLGHLGKGLRAFLQAILIGDPKGKGAAILGGAILRLAAVVVVLVALPEIADRGKTIVLPFNTPDVSDEEKKQGDLGRIISDRVVNTLGSRVQELQPEMAVYLSQDSEKPGSKEKGPKVTATGQETSGLQATSDVDIWGAKVPLSLVSNAIREPMRHSLGIRVIRGSLEREGGRYVLLANASSGETWQAPEDPNRFPGAPENAPRKTLNDRQLRSLIDELADEIADRVMSSDRAFTRFGMTESLSALRAFRGGVELWKKYERDRKIETLIDCIDKFGNSVIKDPQFALARYRLGLALAEEGQLRKAANAFQVGVRMNSHFSAARLALAEVDFFFPDYQYPPLPPALSRTRESEALTAQRVEAREQWRHVIGSSGAEASRADRARAYSDLCLDALLGEAQSHPYNELYRQAYFAFFYCRKAEDLYSRLSGSLQGDFPFATEEATVQYQLRFALELAGRPQRHWARRKQLEHGFSAHRRLAEECTRRASATEGSVAAKFYWAALAEYEQAIAEAPRNTDGLNGYAYTLWQWQSTCRLGACPLPPGGDTGKKAELYARKAVTLTSGKVAEIQSTLGEVLLADDNFEEAIKELKNAYYRAGGARSDAYFNEIRLDLAQAYLNKNHCRLDSNVTRLLDEISYIESTRQSQPYTNALRTVGARGPARWLKAESILCEQASGL